MNILKKIVVIILVFSFKGNAQINPGAKQISLSHSDVALSMDCYAIFNNPAGLSQQNWSEFSIYYSPSPFGINKLSNASAVFHFPTDYGSFAFAYTNYGFDLYNENNLFVSYSRRLFSNLFVGTTLSYRYLSIKNYGSGNNFNILVGGIVKLTDYFRIGFTIDNLTHSNLSDYEDQIPMKFDFGISYAIFNNLLLNTSVQKEIGTNTSIRVGIDYQLIKYLNLRFGAMNNPSSFSAGIGINYSIFEIDYAVFNHQDLGLTHQFGITILLESFNESRFERINKFLMEQ
jgi:hypothetical protein